MHYDISVIIATYNCEKWIKDTFSSLLQQSIGFERLQILFADDFSTDSTPAILSGWSAAYGNVSCFFLDHNSGYCGAPRNAGLRGASAPLVMYLDADDYYETDACENLFNAMKDARVDMASGFFSTFDETGVLADYRPEQSALLGDLDPKQYESRLQFSKGTWRNIYRRKLIEKYKLAFEENIPGQDTIFSTNYILRCGRIRYIDKRITYYRIREKGDVSVSYSRTLRYYNSLNTCYHILYDAVKDVDDSCVRFLFSNTLYYNLRGMTLSGGIDRSGVYELLATWQWISRLYERYGISCSDGIFQMIVSLMQKNELATAVNGMMSVREQFSYIAGLEEAKAWYLQQISNYQAAIAQFQADADAGHSNPAEQGDADHANPAEQADADSGHAKPAE